jgi:glycosyltransferase involved in cell wall biosynthesis
MKTAHAIKSRVSVIMPVYNDERCVGRAVESILSQTLVDLELIVVNDGSTDNSAEKLKFFTDPRLRIVSQANKGIAAALNAAIDMATAPLIARMDSDDIALPERLEVQVKYLEDHPDCGMVGSSCELINEEGISLGHTIVPTDDRSIRRCMIWANPFIHSSIMIRKEVLDIVGRYDAFMWEDYDLWWRVLLKCRVANMPTKLMIRTHRLGATTRISKTKHYREMYRIQRKASRLPGIPWTIHVASLYSLAAWLFHWLHDGIKMQRLS